MARSGGEQYFSATIKTPVYKKDSSGKINRSLDDVNIMFSCPTKVATWLDIDPKYHVKSSTTTVKVNAHERTKSVIGETVEGKSTVAAYDRTVGFSGRQGSKVAIIETGKLTKEGSKRKATISFRFPQKATAGEISDLLGTVIPANKIKSDPTASDVRNVFRLKGGRSYGIMTQTEAQTNTQATAPATAATPTP